MAKKTPAKKSPAKKAPAKKSPAKKAPAKKAPAKKAPAKKAAAKKAPAKKSAAKKAPAKKAPAKKSPAKKTAKKAAASKTASSGPRKGSAGTKPPTKAELYRTLADKCDLSRKQVVDVLDQLEAEMAASLKKHGEFNLLSLAKLTVVKKPATKARPGRNPFTGEDIMIKAKPASKAVKVRALKNLKEYVN
ncbi:HU family DNA-binding protein [Phycisphaera mikurensis]|uniref:Viral histone-like protein n=1 Tax=Phycisphaera mikurensis (strain NBRC 102666 / KCTC 22515 / FYK2301M01) TaxID=1142394 RepID=I0IE46_PHYMF|nr:HU family DNA-binding protein [Phycisphaera mikurensis]MBB6441339.1 nucleoid DNA-binding protein [Phycisphaera mikurensis]BAM03534.1 putative DNA-binding protein [Phycisphaera mikurensis NBRC 102666]